MPLFNKSRAAHELGISKNRLDRLLGIVETYEDFQQFTTDTVDKRVILLSEWHIEKVRELIERQEGIVRGVTRPYPQPNRPTTPTKPKAAHSTSDHYEVMKSGHRSWAAFVAEHATKHQRTVARFKGDYAVYGNYVSADGVRCNWSISHESELRCISEHPDFFT